MCLKNTYRPLDGLPPPLLLEPPELLLPPPSDERPPEEDGGGVLVLSGRENSGAGREGGADCLLSLDSLDSLVRLGLGSRAGADEGWLEPVAGVEFMRSRFESLSLFEPEPLVGLVEPPLG